MTASCSTEWERLRKVNTTGNRPTTYYLAGGLWEEGANGPSRTYYQFRGSVVVMRTTQTNGSTTAAYLNGDHLGSASVASDTNGNILGLRKH